MLVGRVHDLVGDPPRPSGADDSTRLDTGPLELVNGTAHRFGDLARLPNVPHKSSGVVALTHRQDHDLGM
jgi:hypothetical protein